MSERKAFDKIVKRFIAQRKHNLGRLKNCSTDRILVIHNGKIL